MAGGGDRVRIFGAGAKPVLVAHGSGQPAGGNLAAVTGAIDTSTATRLVIATAYSTSITGITGVSDSKSNTWAALTAYSTGSNVVRLFHCLAPTSVGSGHTFTTVGGSNQLAAIAVVAFSDPLVAVAADFDNGAAGDQPGSGTPSTPRQFVIAALESSSTGAYSINSGFTITDQIALNAGSSCRGIALAYLVQGAATAVNPTWSTGGGTDVCAMTSFK